MSKEVKLICDLCGDSNMDSPHVDFEESPEILLQVKGRVVYKVAVIKGKGREVHACGQCLDKIGTMLRDLVDGMESHV